MCVLIASIHITVFPSNHEYLLYEVVASDDKQKLQEGCSHDSSLLHPDKLPRDLTDIFKIFSVHGHVPLAQVSKSGKVLNVVTEGQSDPTFTIASFSPYASLATFPNQLVTRKQGTPVVSTRFGRGNSYMLTVHTGRDPCLKMTCLAILAENKPSHRIMKH